MGNKKTNILVIDTDQAFVDELRVVLESRDIGLVHTTDPEYGIDTANRDQPSLIVLNADVPKGFAVCRKIKKDAGLRDIPLVLTTARASEETMKKHKTLNTRADYYLRKPFDADEILSFIPIKEENESDKGQESVDSQALDELRLRLSDISRERNVLKSRVSKMDSLEKQIQTYQGTVKALESSIRALNQRASQLENELAEKESVEQGYLRQIEELKRNEGLAENMSQQFESTTTLFEQLEQGYKQRIAGLNSETEQLSEQLLNIQRENAGLLEKISQMEVQNKGYEALRARAMNADNLEEQLQRMGKELNELREYHERMQPLQKKIGELESLEAQLAVAKKERDELLFAIGEMEIQMKKNDQELHHTSEQYQKLQKDLADIRRVVCTKE